MKKGVYFIAGFVAAILVVLGIFAVTKLEKEKKSPVENYTEKNTGTDIKENGEKLQAPDSGLVKDGVAEFVYDSPVINNDIRHTFSAYDLVDGVDILTQTKYPLEYFGEEPTTTEIQHYFDEDRFKEEMPELYEAHKNMFDSGLSENEIWEISDQYKAAKEDYMVPVEYAKCYVFFKCSFENLSEEENEINVNGLRGMITGDDFTYYTWADVCYFDSSQHMGDEEDRKSYYVYTLQPGETLECIIGIEVYHSIRRTDVNVPDLDSIYFGYEDVEIYTDFVDKISPYSPVYGKYVFKVADLKEMED